MNTIFNRRFPLLQILMPIKRSAKSHFSTEYFPMDKFSSLKKDVLLYTYEKTKMFRYFSIFGFAQFGICTYLGCNIILNLKDTGQSSGSEENSGTRSWRNINFGAMKYKLIAGLSCISIGVLTAYIAYALPTRIVKELILCKGGQTACVVTHGPFGRTNRFKINIQQMSCMISRDQATSYIPLKVKNKMFYYLMDCKGQFLQPRIFDLTVGAKSWGR